jgi:hypothetical protein
MTDLAVNRIEPRVEIVDVKGCESAVLRTYDFSKAARPAGAVALGQLQEQKLTKPSELVENAKLFAGVVWTLLTYKEPK